MPRGGARPGAGRPLGSTSINNTATRRIIEQAEKDNILPLAVMFDELRFYRNQANELIAKLLTDGAPQLEAAEGEGEGEPHDAVLEALREVLGIRGKILAIAGMAAQYVHPRQGFAADDAPADDHVPLADRVAEMDRRAQLAAAGDKVVDLTARTE